MENDSLNNKLGPNFPNSSSDFDNLMKAIKENKPETHINTLINKIPNLNFSNHEGQTCLMMAVQQANKSITSNLIKAGVNLDQQDNDGFSALMLACVDGNIEMVETLLDAGANPDLRTKNSNFSAYDLAVESYHNQLVEILKSRRLDQYSLLHHPITPSDEFVILVKNGEYQEAMSYFERNSVDINHQDNQGKTAAIYTAINSKIAADIDQKLHFFNFLKENGANFTIADNEHKTALSYCLINQSFEALPAVITDPSDIKDINLFPVIDDHLLDKFYEHGLANIADILIKEALDKGNLFITSKDSAFFELITQSLLQSPSITNEDNIDKLITLSNNEIMLESLYSPSTHYIEHIPAHIIKDNLLNTLKQTQDFDYKPEILETLTAICEKGSITLEDEHEFIITPIESPNFYCYFIFEFDDNDKPCKISLCNGTNNYILGNREDKKTYGIITYPIDLNQVRKSFPDKDIHNCKEWLPEAVTQNLQNKRFIDLVSPVQQEQMMPFLEAIDSVFEMDDFHRFVRKVSILCKEQSKDNDVAKSTHIALRFLLNKQYPELVFDKMVDGEITQGGAGYEAYKLYKDVMQEQVTNTLFNMAQQVPDLENNLEKRIQRLCDQTELHIRNKGHLATTENSSISSCDETSNNTPPASIKSKETGQISPLSIDDLSLR